MLTIKELTVKNFMSVGNQAQAIKFTDKSLVLVIGENMDLGGDDAGARNGTGKTTIINALSYVFFGEALTNIRRDNLVNKTNEKGMVVSVKFIKNNVEYTIERGRKPQNHENDIRQAPGTELWLPSRYKVTHQGCPEPHNIRRQRFNIDGTPCVTAVARLLGWLGKS